MALPGFIQKHLPLGTVLLTESNPKNEKILTAFLKKYRYKALFAQDYEAAIKILTKKKVLGAIIDHTFKNDREHTGKDVIKFVRADEDNNLKGLPVFLVASIQTMDLVEYEYLKINDYFDTEETTVKHVIEESVPYFLERD